MPTAYATVAPGIISPRRPVPASIERPEYVDKPTPNRNLSPEVTDAETAAAIAPGVSTDEIDRVGHEFLLDHCAYPSTLGYRGFPKSLCTSVNEVVCHGIPD